MERSPKRGKHLWCRMIMPFICQWQCSCGSVPDDCGLHLIYCNHLWVSWICSMWLEKVVIVLCWWAAMVVLLSNISMSLEHKKEWFRILYSLILSDSQRLVLRKVVFPSYFIKFFFYQHCILVFSIPTAQLSYPFFYRSSCIFACLNF